MPISGVKITLIERIIAFVRDGSIIAESPLPLQSCKQKGKLYPLSPQTSIVKGAYKNDAATRHFFKQLIGEHFHFTAWGIDWIKEQWHQGNPPTYQEFASFWQAEHTKRQKYPAPPKAEWAYINFVQKYPNSSAIELKKAWKNEREKQVQAGLLLLQQLLDTKK